ncbi:hypothetical protein J3A83DRAFT_997379 [Scleroderma citrinum]
MQLLLTAALSQIYLFLVAMLIMVIWVRIMRSSPVPNSHQGSPGLERSSDLGESDGTPINTPVKFKIPAKPLTVSKPTSTRKKTAADLAWEVAEAECHVHFQMAHINAKEKTTCEQIKQRSAQKTALEIEELHLRHQQEEGVSAST